MDKPSPLKILIVGYGSGEETFLRHLISGLANEGIQITLATASKKSLSKFSSANIHWLWAPRWDGSFLTRFFRMFWLIITRAPSKKLPWLINQIPSRKPLREQIKSLYRYLPFTRGNWDIIYFPWNSAAVDYIGFYDFDIPIIVSCRGSQINIRPFLPGNEKFTSALHTTLTNSAAVHCVSSDIQKNAMIFGLDKHKSYIIRPAVDISLFKPTGENNNNPRFTVVTTGSLTWRKGYEYLLIAFKKLIDAGIDSELHIIGDGDMRQNLMFTLHDLSIQNNVFFHGQVSPSDVLNMLQKADVFVLSSLSEGISNAVLEAMSCGLPVISTNCGGMNEAISNGIDGFLVPVRDPDAMFGALVKLANNPKLGSQMGHAARQTIIAKFDIENQISQFIDVFEKTTSNLYYQPQKR